MRRDRAEQTTTCSVQRAYPCCKITNFQLVQMGSKQGRSSKRKDKGYILLERKCTRSLIVPLVDPQMGHWEFAVFSRKRKRSAKDENVGTPTELPSTIRSYVPGGVLLGLFIGVCRPQLQIRTQFQTKKYHFPYPFSDLASKINTRFQT